MYGCTLKADSSSYSICLEHPSGTQELHHAFQVQESAEYIK